MMLWLKCTLHDKLPLKEITDLGIVFYMSLMEVGNGNCGGVHGRIGMLQLNSILPNVPCVTTSLSQTID